MLDSDLHIRRARRTDFTAVMHLLAASGVPVPPPERATLHRFRNIVNDLGGDFYLAYQGGNLVGVVHATYTRRIALPPLARIEQLVVAAESAPALVGFIWQRALKRGCSELRTTRAAAGNLENEVLERAGLNAAADAIFSCSAPPQT